MITSPIFYMGNKKKLIDKGLVDLFPSNIDTFVDLFGGSAVVSLNTKANRYILNDKDKYLYSLYEMFSIFSADQIINTVNCIVDEYGLARERTKRNVFQDKEKIACYKKAYNNLRIHYNQYGGVWYFYALMFYSFSQQFRFNNKGEFNMPCGNDYFSKKNENYIREASDFFRTPNTFISCLDFEEVLEFENEFMTDKYFVYCDPPYLNTTAVYNERGNGWSESDEKRLLNWLDKLSQRGVRFALSANKSCRGKTNDILLRWLEEHPDYNVHSFDDFDYCPCGKGKSNVHEILVTNYKV